MMVKCFKYVLQRLPIKSRSNHKGRYSWKKGNLSAVWYLYATGIVGSLLEKLLRQKIQ